MTEKKINTYINLWLRCPGTIINATLALIIAQNTTSIIEHICITLTIMFSFRNGIYYMYRVVVDYTIQSNKHLCYRRMSSTE